jgi:hypothetical protein
MRKTLVLLAALLPAAAHADDMAKAVEGFYGAYAAFHPSDGIPDAQGRAKYQPFISPALEKLLVEASKAEDDFAKANKGSPPLIEGDLFTSNFEGATLYKIGPCSGDARKGRCPVALTYDPRGSNPKDKPVTWTDTVSVVATPVGWKVDDIAFGATWEFGNHGSLVKTLQDTIANAGN